MKFICFDTATDALSCALWSDGEVIEHDESAPRRHADRLLPVIGGFSPKPELPGRRSMRSGSAAVPARSPGFGSRRASRRASRSLWTAPRCRSRPSPQSRQGSLRENGSRRVLALLDARLGEVYAGAMRADDGVMRPVRGERLCLPGDLVGEIGACAGWTGCGPGWNVCTDALAGRLAGRLERLEPGRLPRARDLATLVRREWEHGVSVAAEQVLPVYLRRQVVRGPEPASNR